MADNIRNFNDYRKKITNDEQATEEINIEIQDPLDFLSADEREEYYRTQHEAMDRERESLDKDSAEFYLDEDEAYEKAKVSARRIERPEQSPDAERDLDKPKQNKRERINSREKTGKDTGKEKTQKKEAGKRKSPKKEGTFEEKPKAIRRKTRIKAEEDWDDEEVSKSGINPLIIVRISSIITGIIILVLIGMIFKAKVYDRYLVPDPDEDTSKVVVGELAGYTRTDDKIITTADLNLRNTPSTASDEFIVTKVPKGTVIDRVAVSDDGEWAQINYEGQLLFCSMKYAQVQE